eukprot:176834_1
MDRYQQRMNEANVKFDATKFGHQNRNELCESVQQCNVIPRLITTLQYYSSLDIMKNMEQANNFIEFVDEAHLTLLDDYTHLVNCHGNDLIEISKYISPCKDIKTCQFTSRHQQVIGTKKAGKEPKLSFYKNVMDSMHFYICHLYDTGLRSLDIDNDLQDEEIKRVDDKNFDKEFYRLNKNIRNRNHLTTSFERFKSNKNNKFNIVANQNAGASSDDNVDGTTYLDLLYEHLTKSGVPNKDIDTLQAFIQSEDFDSETITFDLQYTNATADSNVWMHISFNMIENKKCVQALSDYVQAITMSSSSFNLGLRMYYWEYYKNIEKIPENEQAIWNVNDHSGYSMSELYIKQRYGSFKEEIANYKCLTFSQYKTEIVLKVNRYINTHIVKHTRAAVWRCKALHYGVQYFQILGFANLLSLVLYTDYSQLCTHFSATFRKRSPYESLVSIKRRNSEYWFMSKTLRETVEIFGGCSRFHTLLGPYYCGMSVVLTMPSFNIRLCSPTSTSGQIEVAIKFSGEEGCIMELNSPKTIQHQNLAGFNCCWISRYKEEDEKLFFGGEYFSKMESIRLRTTQQNFKDFIHTLCYLDFMLFSGGQKYDKIKKGHVKCIKHLINVAIGNESKEHYDPYVYSTFKCFVTNQKQMILNLPGLKGANNQIVDLVMHSLEETNLKTEDFDKLFPADHVFEEQEFTNLLHGRVFNVFKNIRNIFIYSGNSSYFYKFSIFTLLTVIESTLVEKVVIQSGATGGSESNSWLREYWSLCGSHIKKQYKRKNFAVTFSRKYHFDLLEIRKIQ